ncbi:hypothetical protein FHG87_001486 [Trinorchestia longiramus]|nr:hypothetical protein FHG87_001486 [Trinorchestia longiramus]
MFELSRRRKSGFEIDACVAVQHPHGGMLSHRSRVVCGPCSVSGLCLCRKTAGSKPGNEYELFLVSRRELALIGKTNSPPMDTSQDRRMELTIILTLRMVKQIYATNDGVMETKPLTAHDSLNNPLMRPTSYQALHPPSQDSPPGDHRDIASSDASEL